MITSDSGSINDVGSKTLGHRLIMLAVQAQMFFAVYAEILHYTRLRN